MEYVKVRYGGVCEGEGMVEYVKVRVWWSM